MTNANAVIDAVSKEVVFDNIEPLAYAVGGAVVYYLIAPHISPLLAKVPFFNQIPTEFQPLGVAAVVVVLGYMMKQKEIMMLGGGMAFASLFSAFAPKALNMVSNSSK